MNNIDRGYLSQGFQDNLAPSGAFIKDRYSNPETSDAGVESGREKEDGWGYVIATSTATDLETWKYPSQSSALAFNILHGMGHLAGFYHSDATNRKIRGFMNEGNSMWQKLSSGTTPESIILNTPNDVISKIQNRYQ